MEGKAFTIEMRVTRVVTLTATALQARDKANNLEFRHEIVGEITHWTVEKVIAAPVASETCASEPKPALSLNGI